MMRLALVVPCVALLATPSGWSQDKTPTPMGEAMHKYLAAQTDRLSQKYLDGAKTLDEWKEKLPRLEREYLDMLGLWPLPERTPLKATVTGQLEAHGVIVEKLHYQSKPGLYVTANLYRPKAHGTPPVGLQKLPAILYVCGHSNKGRDGNKTAFQDHGFWFASNGYVCLMVDTLQLGEIPGVHHGTYGRPWNHLKAYGIKDKDAPENRWWWHSAGYTPAGVECWNGVRGIDYLLTRPEVDPERIGVTGISGGGAATLWIAAADRRVKVAVPVSGMSDLESYVNNKVVDGHCDCMFLYNNYRWEWTTIAALVAPRPMLFANSDNDSIFPMDGNRRIIEKLHILYFKYGKADALEEYVSKGGHAYRPDLRVAIFKFINKHLKGDAKAAVEDSAKYQDVPGKELRVFPTDADVPKDARNAAIDETFVPRAKAVLPEPGKFAEWKQARLEELKQRVFHVLTDAKHVDRLPFSDQAHLVGKGRGAAPMLVMERKQFDAVSDFRAFAGTFGAKQSSAFLYFSDEVLSWTRKSPPNYVERSHVLLGETTDTHKVCYLMKAARQLAGYESDMPWDRRVVGQGSAGILGAYAALFEPAIKGVVVIDPPKSHLEGPHFLGVLKVLDVPEALGLLAPTPLTVIGGDEAAFERTAEIYRRAGAADKLKRR
jgi:dienelactone hydrolase